MSPSALEDIALRCVPGEGAVKLRRLASGLVNQSCRVSRAGQSYSLRVATADSRALGIERIWECSVLRCATAAGLAPRVEHCGPGQGILVSRWADGHAWSAAEVGDPDTIAAMARILRRVHALRVPGPVRAMNPAAWIAHYTEQSRTLGLGEAPSARLRAAAEARLARLAALPARPPVLCHGDLHPLNVIVGSPIMLLDWEYAHIADPYWDFAGWLANTDSPAHGGRDLLAGYLERPPRRADEERLELLVWLYDYVCLLWSELYLKTRPGPAGAPVFERAEHLQERLGDGFGSRAG